MQNILKSGLLSGELFSCSGDIQIQPATKPDFLRIAGLNTPQISIRLLVHAAHAASRVVYFQQSNGSLWTLAEREAA